MKQTITEIIQELNKRFSISEGNPVTIHVNEYGINPMDGDIMTISLIPMPGTNWNFEDQPDGILGYAGVKVTGTGIANIMSGSMCQFLKRLDNYQETVQNYRDELEKCASYAAFHMGKEEEGDGPIMFYQEWHRNLFGFTPWGWEFNTPHNN